MRTTLIVAGLAAILASPAAAQERPLDAQEDSVAMRHALPVDYACNGLEASRFDELRSQGYRFMFNEDPYVDRFQTANGMILLSRRTTPIPDIVFKQRHQKPNQSIHVERQAYDAHGQCLPGMYSIWRRMVLLPGLRKAEE